MPNLKKIGTLIQKLGKNSKNKYFQKIKSDHLQQLYGDGHSPKNPPKSYFICFKIQAKRSSLCRPPHHTKLTIFENPSLES